MNLSTALSAATGNITNPDAPHTQQALKLEKELNLQIDFNVYSPETRKLKRLTEYYCRSIITKQNPFWITLLGQSGAGKTHLSRQVIKHINNRPEFTRHLRDKEGRILTTTTTFKTAFFTWKTILDDYLLKEDYGILDYCASIDLLVLDDLFSEKTTEFGIANLFKLLNSRLGKWTFITSNDKLGTIKEKECRISSRMERGNNLVYEMFETCDYALQSRPEKQALFDTL